VSRKKWANPGWRLPWEEMLPRRTVQNETELPGATLKYLQPSREEVFGRVHDRNEMQGPYLEAFLGTKPLNLPTQVAVAERAIYLRTEELRSSADQQVEWRAIADAISGLSILKKEIKHSAALRTEQQPEISKVRTRAN
jgi:hypothetical protein